MKPLSKLKKYEAKKNQDIGPDFFLRQGFESNIPYYPQLIQIFGKQDCP